jgi:hypothetical protein
MPLGKCSRSAEKHGADDLRLNERTNTSSVGSQQVVLEVRSLLRLDMCVREGTEACCDAVDSVVVLNDPLDERTSRLHPSIEIVACNGSGTSIRNGHNVIHREW